MKKKQRVFWFHYNKPESKRQNKPKLTFHYKSTCHIVDHIVCNVPIETKHNKSQPRVVLKGKSNNVTFGSTTENLNYVYVN